MKIVKVLNGKQCTIRGVDSEVILHAPSDIYGVILAKIHTDHSKFSHHIPRDDCSVSPICEYVLKPFTGYSSKLPEGSTYTIQIPHIIRNMQEIRKCLKIQHGDIHSKQPPAINTLSSPGHHERDISFNIDDKYVTIRATHFSGFIVTSESVNCCSDSAKILVFGSLNEREGKHNADLKVYSSKRHHEMSDYLKVNYHFRYFSIDCRNSERVK